MAHRDIVLIGASAGGVRALLEVVPHLPADLPAAVLITMHVSSGTPTMLPQILRPRAALSVKIAEDGALVEQGTITIAASDRHLMLEADRIRLTVGPRENRARPAVDVMFRSAAAHYGSRCIGIILTGMLDDGTAGLWAVKDRGGIAIAQSPQEAEYSSMPSSAIQHVQVDHVVTLAEMPALLARLTREPIDQRATGGPGRVVSIENAIAEGRSPLSSGVSAVGPATANTCPHCHGTLFKVRDGGPARFRCHTGHAFSPLSLLADLDASIESGLWSVVRSIDERLFLARDLLAEANANGDTETAQEYARMVEEATLRMEEIRALLLGPAAALRHRVA